MKFKAFLIIAINIFTVGVSFAQITLVSHDFNSGDNGWTTPAVLVVGDKGWVRDNAADTQFPGFDGAYWRISRFNTYRNNTHVATTSGVIDLTGKINLVLNVDIRYKTVIPDGMNIEYSANGGGAWTVLGGVGDGTDWFNDPDVDGISSNTDGWSGDNSAWQTATIDLPAALENNANVQFRVNFGSNAGGRDVGVAFDNFIITGYSMTNVISHDFNSGDNGWTTPAVLAVGDRGWIRDNAGDTQFPGFDGAYWRISRFNTYRNNTHVATTSGVIDLTGKTNLVLNVDIRYKTAASDGMNIEYSANGGRAWTVLGGVGDGTNWFNDPDVDGISNNTAGWSGDNSAWQTATIDLPAALENNANVQFRANFGSGASVRDVGVAFDNFIINSLSTLPTIWYSYQSGNWNDAATWTLDGGILPLYINPTGAVPSSGDVVVITSGRVVTIQSTTNNLRAKSIEVVGELDLTSSFGHTFATISGTGRILSQGNNRGGGTVDNFPSGNAASFADAAVGGTLVVSGAGIEFDQTRTFNNMIVEMDNATDELVVTANLTLNGDLTITNGIFKINNNAGTAVINITINQNVVVASAGQITVGTGNTINGAYNIGTSESLSTLPASGDYAGIYHQFTIGGDFTNSGIVRFTNLVNPDYNDFTTTGAANVFFTGRQSNLVTLLGQTDFYNLIVNKGNDQSHVLEINSSATTNFKLFGPNVLAHIPHVFSTGTVAGFTLQNPEVKKALWIRNGTLKLSGKIHIPTLVEGEGVNFQYFNSMVIPETAALWLNGDDVEVYSTARSATPEVAGHDGVDDGFWGQGLAVYGKLRVSAGVLGTRNSSEGLALFDTPLNARSPSLEIVIEGGTVTCTALRDRVATGTSSYTQTGGTFNITGNPTVNFPARFGFSSPDFSFTMSGGSIVMDGNGRPIEFVITASEGNYDVTGGNVIFNMDDDDNLIDVNANLWDVEINSTNGNRTITLEDDLVIGNNLSITANATLDVSADNYNVTIGADIDVVASGTYQHQSNTTTINGGKETNITLGALQTFNNLTIAKENSEKVNIVSAPATAIQVDGAFRLEEGYLEYNTFTLDMKGSLHVADTIGGDATTGRLLLSGIRSQNITSSGGVLRNIELNNSNGISLSGDLMINNTLTLTDGVFDINTSRLTMSGTTANIAGTFGVGEMIQTSGNASGGGLEMYLDASETLTFPIGTDANGDTRYTPLVAVMSSFSDDGYLRVSLVDEVLATTDGTGGIMLSYYWHVEHRDFTMLPKVTSYTFSGSENDDGTGNAANYPSLWRAGKVLAEIPFTRSSENQTSINNPSGHDINFDGDGTPFDLENANYSAGPSNRFNGTPDIYYSRQDGNFNTASTWSQNQSDGSGTPAVPVSGSILVIQDSHKVNVRAAINDLGAVQFDHDYTTYPTPSPGNVPRLQFHISGTFELGLVSGSGMIAFHAPNAPVVNGDFGDFGTNSDSYYSYFGGTATNANATLNAIPTPIPNMLVTAAPTLSTVTVEYSVDQSISVNYDLIIQGDVNLVPLRDIDVGDDLKIGFLRGGRLLFPNTGSAVTMTVNGDIDFNSDNGNAANSTSARSIRVRNMNAPALINHRLILRGNILKTFSSSSTIDLYNGFNRPNVILELQGTTNGSYTSRAGSTTDLYRLVVNKGNSQTSSFSFDGDFDLLGRTDRAIKALDLKNGTLVLNHADIDIDLSTGGGDFSIPGTSGLKMTLGEVNVTGDDTGIFLGGSLIIDGGTVDMDDTANNGNNYIEYSASGNAVLSISSGSLTVGSQIKRNIRSGVLQYQQTGGTVIVGKNEAPEENRGVFEVLNAGSDFTLTGGDITLVRQNGAAPQVAALHLLPATSNVTGSTITIGNTDTPTGQNDIRIKSNVALNNLVINGNNNPTVNLEALALSISGDLTVGSNNTLDGNTIDLTITGDFTNNGSYLANSNTTFFNAPVSQHYSGTGTESFYSVTKTGAGTLDVDKNITITNVLDLDQGIFDSNAQTITLEGNMMHDATHTSTSGEGIVFSGSSQQDLERSSAGTSNFGIITINNTNGVRIPNGNGYNFDINDGLRLDIGVFDIGSSLLTLSTTAEIEAVSPFSVINMIQTNSSFIDNGVKKNFPTIGSLTSFTYPIGHSKYTPVVLAITSMDPGSIRVRPADELHPGILEDLETPNTEIIDADNVLQYYWILAATDIASMTASATFTYDAGDLLVTPPYTNVNYIPTRLLTSTAMWDKAFRTADFDEGSSTFTIDITTAADALISGDYTAGVGVDNSDVAVNGAIPNAVFQFESNSTGGGNFDTPTSWTTTIPSGGPTGAIVTVKSGDVVTLNNNSVRLLRTIIESGAVLEVDNTSLHRLGDVSGAGTLRIISNGINANLPTGIYSSLFDCATGGTLEYAGTGSYNMLLGISQLRGLNVTGSGTRTLSNNDIIICENFTLTGPTFNNTFNKNISVQGDMNLTFGILNTGLTNVVDVGGTLNITGGTYNGQSSGNDVIGTFNMTSGAFDLDNSIMTIEENMTYSGGTFDSGTGNSSIILNGSAPQVVTGTFTGSAAINRLEINNSSGVSMQNNANISNELELTSGILSPVGTFTLDASAIVTPATGSATSFVNGKLNKIMNASSSFIFPIGKGTRWGYASVNNVSTAGLTWEAEYFDNAPTNHTDVGNITPTDALSIKSVSDNEYWVISSGNVAASGSIGLSWDTDSDVSSSQPERETLKVMAWNDGISTWDDYGGGGYSSGHSQSDGSFTSTSTVNFSEHVFTLGSGNAKNVLPITLKSFKGYAEDGRHLLEWVTSSEINNDYFELERSADGKNFKRIAEMDGAGTTSEEQQYQFIDNYPFFGKNYYRLRQVDLDGKSRYADHIVLLDNNNSLEALTYMLYPNPTNRSNINIEINTPDTERDTRVSMYDLRGRLYYSRVVVPDELHQLLSISLGREANNGMYIVIVEQGDQKVQKKLVIQ